MKFHISIKGLPVECKAYKVPCPRGGDEEHFGSFEEAEEYADRMNDFVVQNEEFYNSDYVSEEDLRLAFRVINKMKPVKLYYSTFGEDSGRHEVLLSMDRESSIGLADLDESYGSLQTIEIDSSSFDQLELDRSSGEEIIFKHKGLPASKKTTDSKLRKISGSSELFEAKHIERRLEKMDAKIDNLIEIKGRSAYLEEKKKNQFLEWEEYRKEFVAKDKDYKRAVANREAIKSEYYQEHQRRNQSKQFLSKNSEGVVEYTFSRASASTYIVYESNQYESIKASLEKQGFEFIERDNIEEYMGENFQVRIADHYPGTFLRSKDRNHLNKVWEYTDASILVNFKRVKKTTTNKEFSKAVEKEKENFKI